MSKTRGSIRGRDEEENEKGRRRGEEITIMRSVFTGTDILMMMTQRIIMNIKEKYIGLWIDHEKAFIVTLIGDDVTTEWVYSHVTRHVRLSSGSWSAMSNGLQDVSAERRVEEQYRNRYHKYYRKVIHEIEDADKIFICGPDEARIELKKEMKRSKERFVKIAGIERVDEMMESQIIDKVKAFFSTSEDDE
jgi:hypothetical protein